MRRVWSAAVGAALALTTGAAEARPLRVMSLDQCADQYVLALAPDLDLALSPRADDADAWLRREAAERRRVRPTLEAAVGFDPDVVVRYWGGEPRLLAALERRGARVVTIQDATDFDGVRANVRDAARALNRADRGEVLLQRMQARLDHARADRPRGRALYLTAGGFTAGSGTLVDAILKAAGYANAAAPGFGAVSVERIVLAPPARFILAFFEQARADWRGTGRHPALQRVMKDRTAARLPGSVLSWPAWFAGDAAAMLADQAS